MIHHLLSSVNTKIQFFSESFKYLILIRFLMKFGVSSEQGSPKNRTAGLVAGHQSLICGELHHPSGLQGKRPAVCQVQDWFYLLRVQAQAGECTWNLEAG
ncbi:MAG: hypothetical protein CL923_06435 [Deltaproteobacteria bacterium]|nr:hypothetical protein [Deltaproteobacteria bacterium]